ARGDRGRFRGRGGGCCRAGNGGGGRGAPGRPRARPRLDGRAPPGGGAGAAEGRGPIPMSRVAPSAGTFVVLSGGSGGVKLAVGLAHVLGERLSVLVNTGDDFTHLGLAISPDVDTMLYSLGGVVNEETGWGRRNETWTFMRALAELGAPTWFRLGDGDLATHVDRTRRLQAGETLTA